MRALLFQMGRPSPVHASHLRINLARLPWPRREMSRRRGVTRKGRSIPQAKQAGWQIGDRVRAQLGTGMPTVVLFEHTYGDVPEGSPPT